MNACASPTFGMALWAVIPALAAEDIRKEAVNTAAVGFRSGEIRPVISFEE